MSNSEIRETFTCPACGGQHTWRPSIAGKMAKCPGGTLVRVPAEPTDRLADLDVDLDEDEAELRSAPPIPQATQRSSARATASRGFDSEPEPRDLVYYYDRVKRFVTAWYVLGPVILILSLAGIVWQYRSAQRHERFMASAQQTTGVISKAADIDEGHKAARLNPEVWKFKFPVTYRVDGTLYETWVYIEGASNLPDGCDPRIPASFPGHSLAIYYDPQDPAHAEAGAFAKGFSPVIGYGLFGTFAAIGLIFLIRRPD